MALPKTVTLCECWARDGLQSIPKVIPTAEKVEMLNRFIDAGVKKMEVTSFSHPKLLPQFADCVEVLRRVERRDDVTYVVLMPNEKGFERFEVCQKEGYGADEIILMISASEAHNKANFRMEHAEAKRSHAAIMKRAHALGVRVIGCTGTVYGCPIDGDVPMDKIIDITRFYIEEGAHTLMLGDTTGAANPLIVRERIGELLSLFPKTKFIAHFHDTRGNGVLNTYTALELGLEFVDTSLGAIGGQPQPSTSSKKYQDGFTGNTCSEDLIALLAETGVETGIDLEKTISSGRRAEDILGRPLRANVIHSGPVSHRPKIFSV
ncbi:MAG: hydroxymethylglutaryl-CoA lyase [Elusimicrobia bacterium CG_4_9_14_3_um_filter_62_55]|nr:MAG: hydroxymethylglutaryl-CoA lyase [Elusimicrobia bacterium CG22_combo_CG10-13_8_21_14_all_63_91]PJA12738.1 MAG: hydroxymethylglutaryl-CoA lyase [Elusimicrobia bacterium CG_4_10_14_0_2_um_filter_63_34]PJB24037.1 MAG: hydroxymethylglutaryl-CoA lyase [Elusimicrobia bacterium CG_4_9_14_3_um_filter_62_55]